MAPAYKYDTCVCGSKKLKASETCRPCRYPSIAGNHDAQSPADAVAGDLSRAQTRRESASLKQRYDEALAKIERLEREAEVHKRLVNPEPAKPIEPRHGSRTSEGVCAWVASDWHSEETVGPEVGDLNRHNLGISGKRTEQFFQNALKLTSMVGRDLSIKTVVLALLGDFITNDIHEELVEVTELPPVDALATVQGRIIAGLEYCLKHSDYEFVIPCASGNHARTTKTTRFGTEKGHSFEHLMYLHLAAWFRSEKRITFALPQGMHNYLSVYEQTIRFHHGHAIKYGGGVGGITIPVNKAIAQWNKARRADLDVFGHFHQHMAMRNYISNGSQIGYNSYALSIKADYEPPQQALFLLDKKRGRTGSWPILYDV